MWSGWIQGDAYVYVIQGDAFPTLHSPPCTPHLAFPTLHSPTLHPPPCTPPLLSYRATAFTNMNAQSSRSHAIVMITVIKRKRTPLGEDPPADAQPVTVGRLYLVDLAGSERLKKSGSEGMGVGGVGGQGWGGRCDSVMIPVVVVGWFFVHMAVLPAAINTTPTQTYHPHNRYTYTSPTRHTHIHITHATHTQIHHTLHPPHRYPSRRSKSHQPLPHHPCHVYRSTSQKSTHPCPLSLLQTHPPAAGVTGGKCPYLSGGGGGRRSTACR